MSRNLKRVPMSFSWPIGATWGGFINPYYKLAGRCPDCTHGYDRAKGRPDANAAFFHDQWYGNVPFDPVAYGAEPLSQFAPAIWRLASRNVGAAPDFYMSHDEQIARRVFKDKAMTNAWDSSDPPLVPFPSFDKDRAIALEAQRLYKLWRYQWNHHLIQADIEALVAADRLHDFTSAWSKEHGWQKREDGYRPTAAEVNAWSLEGFGHDGINSHVCVRARCLREGVPYECLRCCGTGKIWPTPEIAQQYEDWKPTAPPIGDGYQLWEDCSEGSPISPVFTSLADLCAWAAENATTFGPHKATADEWREMLDGGVVHAKDERGNVFL